MQNAGGEGSVIVAKVAEGSGDFGYNAKTDEFVNMLEAGIIDPTKVTRVALENAASVSGMLLTTECVITEVPKPESANATNGRRNARMMLKKFVLNNKF